MAVRPRFRLALTFDAYGRSRDYSSILPQHHIGGNRDSERKQLGPAEGDTQSHTGRGLFTTMVLYNPGAALIIESANIRLQPVGVVLWPPLYCARP